MRSAQKGMIVEEWDGIYKAGKNDYYYRIAGKRYVRGGYDVIIDGIIGPWFLKPWINCAREGYEIHYIILRSDREETLRRALTRSKLDRETNIELVKTMWPQFEQLGIYEQNVIDTTTYYLLASVFHHIVCQRRVMSDNLLRFDDCITSFFEKSPGSDGSMGCNCWSIDRLLQMIA